MCAHVVEFGLGGGPALVATRALRDDALVLVDEAPGQPSSSWNSSKATSS